MPHSGAHRLSDLPPDYLVRLTCLKCERRGQYPAAILVARFGADYPLPGLLSAIPADCPRVVNYHASDACGARFADPWPWMK